MSLYRTQYPTKCLVLAACLGLLHHCQPVPDTSAPQQRAAADNAYCTITALGFSLAVDQPKTATIPYGAQLDRRWNEDTVYDDGCIYWPITFQGNKGWVKRACGNSLYVDRCGAASPKLAKINALPLAFHAPCDTGQPIVLAAVGDLLLHGPIQQQIHDQSATLSQTQCDALGFDLDDADERGGCAYFRLLAAVQKNLSVADVTLANLEQPLARNIARKTWSYGPNNDKWGYGACEKIDLAATSYFDPEIPVYTTFPAFNVHPGFALAIAKSGIDLVSTANNHALDRCAGGIDATLQSLSRANLPAVGTVPQTVAQSQTPNRRYRVITAHNMRLGVVAYTQHTNGWTDDTDQVSYMKLAIMLDAIEHLKRKEKVDMVIVLMHWGLEYAPFPEEANRKLAYRLLENGADMIIGSHPHVLQPLERYTTTDGRDTLIAYSLGNFLTGQQWADPVSYGAILYISLMKGDTTQWISGVRYLPVYVDHTMFEVHPLPTTHPWYQNATKALRNDDLDGDKIGDISLSPQDDISVQLTNPACAGP